MLIIDAHSHIGEGKEYSQSPEELLRIMDVCEVERAVICPSYRFISVNNKEGNDLVLKAVMRFPNRFYGFAIANPWDGLKAVEEIKQAISAGLYGIKFHSPLQGFMICDEIVYPLIEVAEELNIPVYFHTGTPINALPLQLANLASKFKNVNFILGHMGATDFKLDAVYAAKQEDNIYLETSYNLPSIILRAVRIIGSHRIIFGSDSPLQKLSLEVDKLNQLQSQLEQRDIENICSKNILRLINYHISNHGGH